MASSSTCVSDFPQVIQGCELLEIHMIPVKKTVSRTLSFLLTRDIKLPAKTTGSDHVVVIAGIHRQQLRWHGWKGKRFWYLTASKMKRKASRQNNCLYYWLITAVCHRERASWPSLMTDTGNIARRSRLQHRVQFLSQLQIYGTKAFIG